MQSATANSFLFISSRIVSFIDISSRASEALFAETACHGPELWLMSDRGRRIVLEVFNVHIRGGLQRMSRC